MAVDPIVIEKDTILVQYLMDLSLEVSSSSPLLYLDVDTAIKKLPRSRKLH
jgi:hypothetical protein